MPVATQPPPKSKPPVLDDKRPWIERLSRSGYFFGALLLHLVVFLMVATLVIFPAFIPPTDTFKKTYVPASAPPPPPPTPQETVQMPTKVVSTPTTVIETPGAQATFSVPMPDLTPQATPADIAQKMMKKIDVKPDSISTARLSQIMQTEAAWGRDRNNIMESGGDPRNVTAKFPVYLASYADGDWACNVHLDAGQISAGSLPNLIAKMNEWSHGNLKGKVMPTPLEIGGPDLLAKMPPFIFFTGHKDFHLTDTEIENLQKYLQNGGAIWGDNALAGSGSRFDVAFKREMKRVIPDIDKNFAEVPLTHDIFTKSWYPIGRVPEGMNFYAEPLQQIEIDGKLAVIYTPNDYSDLYTMRILPGDTQMAGFMPKPEFPLFTNRLFWNNRDEFFRNYELPASLQAQQLGMNIIGFLLVRFDKDLLLSN